MEADWNIDPKLKQSMKIVLRANVSKEIADLFCEATKIISKTVHPKPLKIIFYREQFKILTSPEHIAVFIKNLILYDLDKIEAITDQRMILAVLLEELVHALLEIDDEVETSLKVSELFPKIKADPVTGQYIIPNKS